VRIAQFSSRILVGPRCPGLAVLALLAGASLPFTAALGQATTAPAARSAAPSATPMAAPTASPAAPGDLNKPAFDTLTPLYDMANRLENNANTVVAEVDGRAITLGDVGDLIRNLPPSLGALPFESLYPGAVEQLVKQQALVVRAQRQGLDEDPVVRRQVKEAADHTLANALLHHEIMQTITEAALLDRYNKDVAGKPGPLEVRVRVIMVPTEAEAAALIHELQGGADFATVAKRSSKDATAPVGGDLGYRRLEALNPEVGSVAFSLAAGQITLYPVKSAGSWFIVKAEDRRQQATPPYAVVREQLVQAMLRDGVAEVVKQALSGVVVREYNFTGKEPDETKPDSAK
jgi:peptidyl-prolyl cis-trans isomerase C